MSAIFHASVCQIHMRFNLCDNVDIKMMIIKNILAEIK